LRQLEYRDSARDDLRAILEYLSEASGSAEVAFRFVERLALQRERLARLPGALGRPREELAPALRSFAFDSYVIFFRHEDHALVDINALHGSRDLPAFFTEGP